MTSTNNHAMRVHQKVKAGKGYGTTPSIDVAGLHHMIGEETFFTLDRTVLRAVNTAQGNIGIFTLILQGV